MWKAISKRLHVAVCYLLLYMAIPAGAGVLGIGLRMLQELLGGQMAERFALFSYGLIFAFCFIVTLLVCLVGTLRSLLRDFREGELHLKDTAGHPF